MRAWWLTGVVACSLLATPAVGGQEPSLELLLAGEPTPGSVALLVEHIGRPEALARLDASLRHARPDVRAAAARVAFVVGARGLLSTMATMLASETSTDPATEMTRALATFSPPSRDELLFAAWSRLGRGQAARPAVAYAAARGATALDALGRLRDVDDRASSLSAFIRAADPTPPQLVGLVERALEAGDATVFGVALSVAADRTIEVPDAVLIRALAPARAAEVRRQAARHAFVRAGAAPFPEALLAALTADTPSAADTSDDEDVLLREFIARAAGRAPTTTREWTARFDDADALLAGLIQLPRVWSLLTDRERRQLGRGVSDGRVLAPAPTSARVSAADVHLLDPYPAGFLPDVMARTGCNLGRAKTQGLGAGAAELTLHPDGRVARVSLMSTGVSQAGCQQAMRVLFMTHVARDRPAPDTQWIAVVPFDREYLDCRESQTRDAFEHKLSARGRITPPRKTRHVNPTYPPGALNAGLQGLVVLKATIGTSGCVGDLRVTSGVDPRLDLAALLSVLGWRFTPTTLDGVAVPVTLTVTVQFTLR